MADINNSILIATPFISKWESLASRIANGLKYYSSPDSLSPNALVYAYKDSGGKPTIGWGTTVYHYGDKAGQNVQMGDIITKQQADMERDYEIALKESIIRPYFIDFESMPDNVYAAFISFAYNAGEGSLLKSNILRLYNSGAPTADIVAAWKKQNIHDSAGNSPLGLVNRRIDESMLFDGSYNDLYSYYLRNEPAINLGIYIAIGILISLSLYLKLVVFKGKK